MRNDYLENYAIFAAYVTDNRRFLASILVMQVSALTYFSLHGFMVETRVELISSSEKK